jgi:limonene-1,2-epoxide hydrolase
VRDHSFLDGQRASWPVTGAYQVRDGRIAAWQECFYPPSDA